MKVNTEIIRDSKNNFNPQQNKQSVSSNYVQKVVSPKSERFNNSPTNTPQSRSFISEACEANARDHANLEP